MINSINQFLWFQYLHLRKAKPFLSQIFDRSSYMINIFIDAKKAIMR